MNNLIKSINLLASAGTAQQANDAATAVQSAVQSLSSVAAATTLARLDAWFTQDHSGNAEFALLLLRALLRERVEVETVDTLLSEFTAFDDGVCSPAEQHVLPQAVQRLLLKEYGPVPVPEPPIQPLKVGPRKPTHGQVLVSRSGSAKRGIGGVPVLFLMLMALSHVRATFDGQEDGDLFGTFSIAASNAGSTIWAPPQLFDDGLFDVNVALNIATVVTNATSFICEVCFNDAQEVPAYPAVGGTRMGSCQVPFIFRAPVNAASALTQTASVRELELQKAYPITFVCQSKENFVTFDANVAISYHRKANGTSPDLCPSTGDEVIDTFVGRWYKHFVDGWQRDLTREGVEPNPGPGPIPKKEWLEEHPKIRALSREKQDAAYDRAMEQRVGKAPREVVPKRVLAQKVPRTSTRSKMSVDKLADNPYTRVVLDPFHAEGARVPDLAPGPTKLFRLKQTLSLNADTNGRAAVFLRPGLGNAIATSGTMSDASIIWNSSPGVAATALDLPEIVFNARSTNGIATYWNDTNRVQANPPDWSNESYAIQRMRNWDKTVEMAQLFGSTRVVAAGLSVRNIANAFEKQGRIVGLQWKGDMGLPGFANANIDIGTTDPQTGAPAGNTGITYENVANLAGAIKSTGADGMTLHSVVTGSRAMTDFRQTAPQPTMQNKVAMAIYFGEDSPDIVPVPIPFPPAVTDSASTQAFVDIVGGLNPLVSADGATVTSAPATGIPSMWTDNIGTGTDVSLFAGTNLYGLAFEGANDATPAADNAILNRAIAQDTMLRVIDDHVMSAMAPGDCGLLMVFDGLKPTTKTVDGAGPEYIIDVVADPFEVEVVTWFEAIPRTGTVEFENAKHMPPHAAIAAPFVKAASIEALKSVPPGHRGPHETELDTFGKTRSATPVTTWIKDAAHTTQGVLGGVGKFLEQNSWIADAAEALFAFL